MKVRTGFIPTEVVYTYAGPEKVYQAWEGVIESEHERIYTVVVPAICCDTDNKKAIAMAKSWANERCYDWDPKSKSNVQIAQVGQTTKENKPFSGLRVVNVDFRGYNKPVYRVVTPDGFCFDIQTDVFLDTMKTEGILPGGLLGGKYLWAVVESEMKLIRKGSDLYTALLEASSRSILSTIPLKKFKVGTVYETKSGDRGLFLGFVDTWKYELTWSNGKNTRYNRNLNKFWKALAKIWLQRPTVTRSFLKRYTLWLMMPVNMYIKEKEDPTQKLLDEVMADKTLSCRIELNKNHVMVKKVKEGIVVPSNVIQEIRDKAEVTFGINQAKRKFLIANKIDGWRDEWLKDEEEAANAMQMAFLRPTGEPDPVLTNADLLNLHSKLGQTITAP